MSDEDQTEPVENVEKKKRGRPKLKPGEVRDPTSARKPRAKKDEKVKFKPNKIKEKTEEDRLLIEQAMADSDAQGEESHVFRPRLWKRGRQSTFKPEYCQMVMEWGAQGKSMQWICAELGHFPMTIARWRKQFPDFDNAVEMAKLLSQQWWEEAGQRGLTRPVFRESIYKLTMMCRFPEDWSPKENLNLSADQSVAELWAAISAGATLRITDESEDEGGSQGEAAE